jgi:zinc transporter, ZIP family
VTRDHPARVIAAGTPCRVATVLAAIGWGALAASSLVLGALLAIGRRWPDRTIGVVLAFGGGALISAVSFELAEEGVETGGRVPVAIGLAIGALTYFGLDRPLERRPDSGGMALALGAFLDGIPEQLVLGIGLASGEPVSVGLLVAIFVSNLPEAIGASSDMLATRRSRQYVLRLWLGVALVCQLATVAGYGVADLTGGKAQAAINGFAAGALLVMLADSMIPEARRKAGLVTGVVLTLGFAVAAGLSAIS